MGGHPSFGVEEELGSGGTQRGTSAGAAPGVTDMLKDIVEASVVEGYRVRLRFEDGVAGELDLSEIIRFEGVFEPLRDLAAFAALTVSADPGTICWPNGIDLDPDVLYARIIGREIQFGNPPLAVSQ
jgi:hypothetical protein